MALSTALVPIDGRLPTEDAPQINDLMVRTLALLLRSLPTRQVATVIDASYAELGTITLGGVRIRSRPNVPSGTLNPAEREQQQQLISRVGVGRADRPLSQVPGLVLAATDLNRIAAEGSWSGFSAGLFTYALTQQLWSTTPATSVYIDMGQAAGLSRWSDCCNSRCSFQRTKG